MNKPEKELNIFSSITKTIMSYKNTSLYIAVIGVFITAYVLSIGEIAMVSSGFQELILVLMMPIFAFGAQRIFTSEKETNISNHNKRIEDEKYFEEIDKEFE